MREYSFVRSGGVLLVLALAGGTTLADPVLDTKGASVTSYLGGTSSVQNVKPRFDQRGSDLEGGARLNGAPGPVAVAPSTGYAAGLIGGIDLATLTWAQCEVDLVFPTDGPSVVIGRTFNHRQGSTKGVVSGGPQGKNWFQSAMPEIVLYQPSAPATSTDDRVYLVLGAGKYLEYQRTGSSSTEFIGVNGASGAFKEVKGSPGTSYNTFELTDGAGTVWTFWGGNTGAAANWQLWKKKDAAGRTAYAGDKTTHSTAVSSGYHTNGAPDTIYQEYGTGTDLRRYTFAYNQTIGGLDYLTDIKVEVNTGGSWATPTEVGYVEYEYYTAATANAVDTTDFYGNAGDLKWVKVRVPLSDSGVSDERTKYYRYYQGHSWTDPGSGATLTDYAHTVKMVLGNEGCRRADLDDNSALDSSFMGTGGTAETVDLKKFSEAFFTYETANIDAVIATAFFNGECGCSGGSGTGTYTFLQHANPVAVTNGNLSNATYDTAWYTRTVVTQPDGAYQTRYFDEVGQPLSTVVSNVAPTSVSPSPTFWVTGVVRDSNGRVIRVHSPANVTGYAHNDGSGQPDGTITYDTSAGLVTLFDRYASGSEPGTNDSELNGILAGARFRTGTTSGSDAYINKSVFSKRAITVGSSTVVRPLVVESRAFFAAASSHSPTPADTYYNAATYAYNWWDTSTNTNQLYITIKSITTTLQAVDTGHNGAGTTDTASTYLRKDGRTAYSVAPDGIITAYVYNNLGLPTRTARDANPHTVSGTLTYPSDFATGYTPTDFGTSTSSNSGLRYASEATYDSVGRTVTSTAHAGTAPRVSYTHYGKLTDLRLTTVTSPLYNSGTPSWTGPFSYAVSNMNGGTEFSATLGPSSAVTTSPSSWITSSSDPIDALHSTLAGTNRVNIRNIATAVYDSAGVKVSEQRKYVKDLVSSGSWVGVSTLSSSTGEYDVTTYTYDSMGRAIRTVDPTGTIDRTVFDAIGRPRAAWTGTIDTNWSPTSGNGSGDDMTQVSATAYDGASVGTGLSVGNGHVTTRETYTEGNASTGIGAGTPRTTTISYDVRGNPVLAVNPQAPHTVSKFDVLRRITATAGYSSSGGLSVTTDPGATGAVSNRVALSKSFYDSRGRVYKTEQWKIDQSDGSDDDSLESLTWYDGVGRAIKTGGTNLSKTFYDRLSRPTHRFTLARSNDSSYTDADDVSGDIVLEESQTVYDDADQTGNVLMSGTIIRNHDDTSTTGALDSNADSDRYTFTAANLAGRIQISAMWYDSLDRATDSVAYGTNGGSNLSRTGLTLPTRGTDIPLRTTTAYDAWGRVSTIEHPRAASGSTGYKTRYDYDHASRKVAEVRNATASPSNLSTALRDNDVYTRFVYTKGLMTRMWVDLDGDNTVDTTDQTTDYVFGVDKTGSGSTPAASKLASNRLPVRATYPEQTSGQATADKSEYFAYNAQGERHRTRDQNGTVHEFTYDTAGRVTIDAAITCGTSIDLASGGSNIDTAVRRVETSYDSRGMVATVTQYDATSSGNIVDQVKNTYDDWGSLTNFQQDYNSAVGAGTADDLGVQYTWSKVNDTSPVSGKRRSGLRITDVKYQRAGSDKQHFAHTYSSSSLYDDDIGRVTTVKDGSGSPTLAEYRYGGLGMVVRTTLSQPGIANELTTTGTSGYNAYLDQFGRVVKDRWGGASTAATWYDARPGYDANSNITQVENAWVTPWSAVYGVDGLNRLDSDTVGTLASGSISNANTWRKETWRDASNNLKLSQTGNWAAYTSYVGDPSVSGNDEFSQTRTHSLRNEMTQLSESGSMTSTATNTPRYARNGSVTRDDTSASGYGYRYTYDAWNRVVKAATQSSVTVAEYRYNGLGHRIGWHYDVNVSGTVTSADLWRYFQYNDKWQQVGMYVETSAGANTVGSNAIETYLYHTAGLGGRGGSSYIDKVVFRDRDANGGATGDGTREERRYYLQNWRHDVVALVQTNGALVERYRYDAYGRPSSFSPADLTGLSGGPNSLVDGSDSTQFYAVWSVGGPVTWQTDLSDNSGTLGPDGATDNGDAVAFNGYYFASYTGGFTQMSDDAVDNRKGLAGYEFDPILNGAGGGFGVASLPVYHVRNRVLNAHSGKWLQKDPLGYHDSMDLYEYCKSDPVDAGDPMGLCSSIGPCAAQCLAYQSAESTYLVAVGACVGCAFVPWPGNGICFIACVAALDAARANLRSACIALQACECGLGAISTDCDNNGVWPPACRPPTIPPPARPSPGAFQKQCGLTDNGILMCLNEMPHHEYAPTTLQGCLSCCNKGYCRYCAQSCCGHNGHGPYRIWETPDYKACITAAAQSRLNCLNRCYAKYGTSGAIASVCGAGKEAVKSVGF